MTIDWKECIGIAATLFVFIGFTQKGETRIRVFNSIGSAIFVVYGILIGSLSVWLLNGACLVLNVIRIAKSTRDTSRNAVSHIVITNNTEEIKMNSVPDIAKVKGLKSNQSKNRKI